MELMRRHLLLKGVATAASSVLAACGGVTAASAVAPPPFPLISDNRAATPDLVSFITAFFTVKTNRDLNGTMLFFSPQLVTYFDATLGLDLNFAALRSTFAQFMPNWPPGSASYPTRIIGDMGGALVAFTETPQLFGGEIRSLASIDINNGQIVRWVDHWDSRSWANLFGLTKSGNTASHASVVGEHASTTLQSVAGALIKALGNQDAASAAALFSYDGVYEDMVLRTQVSGNAAIQRYFARSLSALPLGAGVSLLHVAGNDLGGGVEWIGGNTTAVKAGVSAIVLDSSGLITRMTSAYDGALIGSGISTLAALSIDP